MSDYGLFVVAPYLAAATVLAATLNGLLRRSPRERFASDSVIPRALIGRNRSLAIGLTGVVVGHAAIVAWPGQLAAWTQAMGPLFLLESGLFVLGLTALVGLLIVIIRHARRTPRPSLHLIDLAFAGVLLVAVVSGLAIAVLYRWAAAWSSVTLAPYLRSLATLQPDLRYLESMPYLVELHLFASSVVIGLVGFTTPARLFLRATNRAIERRLTPMTDACASRWQRVRHWVRQSGDRLLWAEDDDR